MIVRTPHKANYVVIDNRPIEDDRLSWKARGLLTYLLSKPDGWKVMVAQLVSAGPDGRQAVESGLSELKAAGYIVPADQGRNDLGRFDSVDTEVHEVPVDQEVDDELPGGDRRGLPAADNARTENPRRVSTKGVSTERSKEPSASPIEKPTETDPVKRHAHLLAVLAHEQTPKPVTRGGFPAVMARIEAELRAGTTVNAIEAAIKAGDVTWTADGLRTAISRAKPRQDPMRRGGPTIAGDMARIAAHEAQAKEIAK